MAHYERLSALDASFLDIEDDSSHMHVAVALVFDGEPLRAPHGGIEMERIRAYVESRLDRIPRYRQRLAYIPFERHPVWVDDPRFNLFYHVRHTALARPGEERQLKRLCGRILSQKLDRTKPLWEIWVVEGLADGRFAMIAKAHHAMVDGIAGMDLLTVLLSAAADRDFEPAAPWQPRLMATPAQFVVREVMRRSSGAITLARHAARAIGAPRTTLAAGWEAARAVLGTLAAGAVPASPTPLNVPIGPHRRFDWLRMDLEAVKAVKARLGGTVNDVVLATVTGGARRFLYRRGVATDFLDFRALVPVSLHAGGERAGVGNRVSNFVTALPISEPDPATRYRRIAETTLAQKRSHAAYGGEVIEELSNWTATAVLTQLMRLAATRRAYNVVVTNIPGPQAPFYLLGAPLLEAHPMVPLLGDQALGVALFSYAGGLFWGLNADWDAVPDLHDFVDALAAEFATLQTLAPQRASAA
jgi:WS/DGAT/MGAT family acyltransferase